MFVLTETHRAVQNSDDPYLGLLLLLGLIAIIVVWGCSEISYRKWKKDLDRKFPSKKD